MPQALPAIGAFFVSVFTATAPTLGVLLARTLLVNFGFERRAARGTWRIRGAVCVRVPFERERDPP